MGDFLKKLAVLMVTLFTALYLGASVAYCETSPSEESETETESPTVDEEVVFEEETTDEGTHITIIKAIN